MSSTTPCEAFRFRDPQLTVLGGRIADNRAANLPAKPPTTAGWWRLCCGTNTTTFHESWVCGRKGFRPREQVNFRADKVVITLDAVDFSGNPGTRPGGAGSAFTGDDNFFFTEMIDGDARTPTSRRRQRGSASPIFPKTSDERDHVHSVALFDSQQLTCWDWFPDQHRPTDAVNVTGTTPRDERRDGARASLATAPGHELTVSGRIPRPRPRAPRSGQPRGSRQSDPAARTRSAQSSSSCPGKCSAQSPKPPPAGDTGEIAEVAVRLAGNGSGQVEFDRTGLVRVVPSVTRPARRSPCPLISPSQ